MKVREQDDIRPRVLGIPFDFLDYRAVLNTILKWRKGARGYIVLTNSWSVELCRRHEEFRLVTEQADLVLPDGAGVILAARLLGYPNRGRVTGPSLMLKLCDWGREAGLKHFFYGGAEGVAEELAARLAGKYPGLKIAGACSPPFRALTGEEDAAIVARINATRPDIVWVALGAPRQEKWMAEHKGRIEAPAMIGVGAAFDFHAGRKRWAPVWVRRIGLEWAFRFFQEPRRLGNKNLGYAIFAFRLAGQFIRKTVLG